MPGFVLNNGAPRSIGPGRIDENGYRTYPISFLVQVLPGESLAAALTAVGLPLPGSPWFIGLDVDMWVWFRPNGTATIHQEREGDPAIYYLVEMEASNRPGGSSKCHEQQVEDPLMEPMKWRVNSRSGDKEEATVDRFGDLITTPLGEQIRGRAVEWDELHDTVTIEQNWPLHELEVVSPMKNTVNDLSLWNLPARCIRLAEYHVEPVYWGQCYVYFKRRFVFEVFAKKEIDDEGVPTGNLISGWDRDILGEGTKVLRGRWDMDEASETFGHYIVAADIDIEDPDSWTADQVIKYQDPYGNQARCIYSDTHRGLPVSTTVDWDSGSVYTGDVAYERHTEKLLESDFLQLGIPPILQ